MRSERVVYWSSRAAVNVSRNFSSLETEALGSVVSETLEQIGLSYEPVFYHIRRQRSFDDNPEIFDVGAAVGFDMFRNIRDYNRQRIGRVSFQTVGSLDQSLKEVAMSRDDYTYVFADLSYCLPVAGSIVGFLAQLKREDKRFFSWIMTTSQMYEDQTYQASFVHGVAHVLLPFYTKRASEEMTQEMFGEEL